jgi:hypothetical protein
MPSVRTTYVPNYIDASPLVQEENGSSAKYWRDIQLISYITLETAPNTNLRHSTHPQPPTHSAEEAKVWRPNKSFG